MLSDDLMELHSAKTSVMQLQHRQEHRLAQTLVMRLRLMRPYGRARQSALCEASPKKQKPRGIAAAGSFGEAG